MIPALSRPRTCPGARRRATVGLVLATSLAVLLSACDPAVADPPASPAPTVEAVDVLDGDEPADPSGLPDPELPGAVDVPSVTATATPQTALATVALLQVKGRAPKTGYSRDAFGPRWADVDRNGCDTRNDILARDLTDLVYKDGTKQCVVASGTFADPYSGTTIAFQRGDKTSSAVQIDHVVALSDAWQKGAQSWDDATRREFANDPLNLFAADGPLNAQKSDSDAATWLPPNKAFRCEYVARQVGVKYTYGVWVTEAERDAMVAVLSTCPDQPLPEGSDVPEAPAEPVADPAPHPPVEPAATQVPAVTQAPAPPAPVEPAPPAPEPVVVPEPAPAPDPAPAEVYYKNCTAARAAGAAPVYRGDPGYGKHLDRDNDGIGCE